MPKAADRVFDDPFMQLAGRAELLAAYGNGLLASVDKALAVQPQDRHQHAGEWVAALRGNIAARSVTPVQPPPSPPQLIPEGFALIPAGEFQMGDALDGIQDAPVHTVHVSAFYMARHEVTKAVWDEVRAWGLEHGYAGWFGASILVGKGKAANHPVLSVTWHDAVKWCNARSERDGLTPCYWVGGGVYRTDICDVVCNWGANGYRLPTESEWEKAARGGLIGKRFPWGDTISHKEANFYNAGKEVYRSGSIGYHPTYSMGDKPYTSPVGSFAANGYGLYNMTGNVWEWCWDKYGHYPSGLQTDPRDATSGLIREFLEGSLRVIRGGYWGRRALYCRVALRNGKRPGCHYFNNIGFRIAHSSVP